jgi:hypothetical protein
MKALVEGFMNRQPVVYLLFGAGAAVAVLLEMLQVPALTFALGMYLPLELNTPALVGGILNHFVTQRAAARKGEAGKAVRERGVVIASGLMAGGALGGVLGAALSMVPRFKDWVQTHATPFYTLDCWSQTLSLLCFAGLCAYLWLRSVRRPAGIHI